MGKKILVPCLDVITIAFFVEKCTVKDHICNVCNVMLQIKMSLKAKLKAIKPLTISLKMVDQTAYYKLINLQY